MKIRLLIVFCFILNCLSGQNETVEISGRVSNEAHPNLSIHCFKARLMFNDTLFVETRCDTMGNYKFIVSKLFVKKFKTRIFIYQDYKLIEQEFTPSPKCPYMYRGPKRYVSPGTIAIGFDEKTNIYKVNFSLGGEACFLPRQLCINFNKNSTEMSNCSEFNADTTLLCYIDLLIHEPSIIIEVLATAFDEKNPQKLSQKRAEYIRQKIIDAGIDGTRIKTKGKADNSPLISSNQIKKAKTKEEKEALKSQNRWARIKILSFDYTVQPKKKQGTNKENVSNDGKD